MKTIFGVASAIGRSGIAVIRISGPDSLAALAQFTIRKPETRKAELRKIVFNDEVIDEALVIYFKAPHSFTGEDVVELHTHGSRAVVKRVLEVLGGIKNLRLAEPGEFSKRAFLNGKMDLAEAEGLADLIDAETTAQARQAMRQMQGLTSKLYEQWRQQIIQCLAFIEAYIDFPDEDLPVELTDDLNGKIGKLRSSIRDYLNDGKRGEKIREGIYVAIIGAPNVGKSSILNYLAGRDAAIVSEVAGTTRDVIEVVMEISGYKVIIADTAGIRESLDEVENEGIRRALQRASEADIKLLVLEAGAADEKIMGLADADSIIVFNKFDLFRHCGLDPQSPSNAGYRLRIGVRNDVSSKTGEGMELLISQISQKLEQKFAQSEAPLITQARHREALAAALDALQNFNLTKPIELTAEDLRYAASAIARITGRIDVDDILDVVFSKFCIGK